MATASGAARFRPWPLKLFFGIAFLASVVLRPAAAWPAELYRSGKTSLRWDNTITYSAAFRLRDPDPVLLSDRNADDGDRNFRPGLVGNRFDLLSQLDFSAAGYGFHVSGAAWYDTVYHERTDNDSPATFNPASVPHTAFTRDVRRLHGQDAELLNAFFYVNTSLRAFPFSFRIGRHTLLWGESLFFPEYGIAGVQAPVDVMKVLGRPSTYASDAFLPVAQVSASLQLPRSLALEAYYQFEWRKTRLPGAGSYLSFRDYYDAGGERFLQRSGFFLFRDRDLHPPDGGQYGGALRLSLGEVDYGLYALKAHAKDPVVYYRSGIVTAPNNQPVIVDSSIVDLSIGKGGTYYLVYPRGIEIYGISASGFIGDSNIAGELSVRRNMPLASTRIFLPPGSSADASRNPAYPVGDTLHAQVSTITNLAPRRIWDSATINAEVALIQRLAVRRNAPALAPESSALALAIRGNFEPTYFEVLPNLDVTLRFSLGYMAGRPVISTYQNQGAGNLDLAVVATYRGVWTASVLFSRFLGSPERQPLADRDMVRLIIQRTL